MKSKLILSFAVLASLPLAAEPFLPVEPKAAPKPQVEEAPPAREKADEEEKATGYLGVSAEAIGEELMLHLGLKNGVTLRTVQPGSPAAKAGLEPNDIITKVGKKAIGSMEELREAIQAHKAGDKVALGVLQKGKSIEKQVELAEAPPELQLGAGIRIFPLGQGGNGNLPQNLQLQFQNFQMGRGGMRFELGGGGAFKMNDGEGSVEMKRRKDSREVTVRDHNGEIQYEGPWDTAQDKAAVSPGMRRRIESVAGMMGNGAPQPIPLQFDILPQVIPPDAAPKMKVVPKQRPKAPEVAPDLLPGGDDE